MTRPDLSLHQFHTLPAEETCHLSISPIMVVHEPVRAVPRGRKLVPVEPGEAAVKTPAGRVGIIPGKTPRAVVQGRVVSPWFSLESLSEGKQKCGESPGCVLSDVLSEKLVLRYLEFQSSPWMGTGNGNLSTAVCSSGRTSATRHGLAWSCVHQRWQYPSQRSMVPKHVPWNLEAASRRSLVGGHEHLHVVDSCLRHNGVLFVHRCLERRKIKSKVNSWNRVSGLGRG